MQGAHLMSLCSWLISVGRYEDAADVCQRSRDRMLPRLWCIWHGAAGLCWCRSDAPRCARVPELIEVGPIPCRQKTHWSVVMYTAGRRQLNEEGGMSEVVSCLLLVESSCQA